MAATAATTLAPRRARTLAPILFTIAAITPAGLTLIAVARPLGPLVVARRSVSRRPLARSALARLAGAAAFTRSRAAPALTGLTRSLPRSVRVFRPVTVPIALTIAIARIPRIPRFAASLRTRTVTAVATLTAAVSTVAAFATLTPALAALAAASAIRPAFASASLEAAAPSAFRPRHRRMRSRARGFQ